MKLFEILVNSKFSSYTSYILSTEIDLFLITGFSAEASSEFIVKKKKKKRPLDLQNSLLFCRLFKNTLSFLL